MAKQLNVSLNVTANTGQAKAELQNLQISLNQLISSAGQIKLTTGLDTKSLSQAVQMTAELSQHLKSATNINTGTLNFTQLQKSLTSSGQSLQAYGQQLLQLGPQGQQAFAQLTTAIAKSEVPLNKANGLMTELFTTLKNTIRWQASSMMLHGLVSGVQGAYKYAKDLNKSLTNIQIVTGLSDDAMAKFAEDANKAAKSLSVTTTSYTNAALIYYQQGIRDQKQIAERTSITEKMANVSGQSAEKVSSELTAIWNNFAKGGQNLDYYADVITALGAATASSSEEISTGLEKFAAVADTVGLSYENATAALATITATTRQSADTVGTGLRTLFARLESLKLGETLEDGVSLTKYSKALESVGVQVLDINGDLRTMDNILEDLGARWQNLEQAEKVALAQTVGGVRQYTTLMALMENFDFYKENQQIAQNAEGTLQKQQEIYEKSWGAAEKRLRATSEAMYKEIFNDKFFIGFTNTLTDALNLVEKLVKALGGIGPVLTGIAAIVMSKKMGKIQDFFIGKTYDLMTMTKSGRQILYGQRQTEATQMAEAYRQGAGTSRVAIATADNLLRETQAQNELLAKADTMTEKEIAIAQIRLDGLRAAGQEYIKMVQNSEQALQNYKRSRIYETNRMRHIGEAQGMNREQVLIHARELLGDNRTGTKGLLNYQGYINALVNGDINTSTTSGIQAITSMLRNSTQGYSSEAIAALNHSSININGTIQQLEQYAIEASREGADIQSVSQNVTRALFDFAAKIDSVMEAWQDFYRFSRQTTNEAHEVGEADYKVDYKNPNNMSSSTPQASNQQPNQPQQPKSQPGQSSPSSTNPYLNTNGIKISSQLLANFSQTAMSTVSSLMMLNNAFTQIENGTANFGTALSGIMGLLPMITIAFNAFDKSIQASSRIISGIALAITAAYAIYKIIDINFGKENDEEKLERLQKESEEAKQRADEASQAYDNLLSKRNQHNELLNTLNSLTEGTNEFKEALLEANAIAQELISTYHLQYGTDYYYDNRGIAQFQEGALDSKQQEVLRLKEIEAQNSVIASAYEGAVSARKQSYVTAQGLFKDIIENIPEESNLTNDQVTTFEEVTDVDVSRYDEFKIILSDLLSGFTKALSESSFNGTFQEYINKILNTEQKNDNFSTLDKGIYNDVKQVLDGVKAENFISIMSLLTGITDFDSYVDNRSPEYQAWLQRANSGIYSILAAEAGKRGRGQNIVDRQVMNNLISSEWSGTEFEEKLDTTIANLKQKDLSELQKLYKEIYGVLPDIIDKEELSRIIGYQQIASNIINDYIEQSDTYYKKLGYAYQNTSSLTAQQLKTLKIQNEENTKLTGEQKEIAAKVNEQASKELSSSMEEFLNTTRTFWGIQGELIPEILKNSEALNQFSKNDWDYFTKQAHNFSSAFGDNAAGLMLNDLITGYKNGSEIAQILEKSNFTGESIQDLNTLRRLSQNTGLTSSARQSFQQYYETAFKEMGGNVGLFEQFYGSEEFAEGLKTLRKELKKTGKISSDSIAEMAEQSEYLSEFLEATNFNAETLADILTGIELRDIGIDQLTEELISAMSAANQLDNNLASVYGHIDNFKKDRSITDVGKFFKGLADSVQQGWESGMLVDEPLLQAWREFFGPESLREYKNFVSELTNDENLTSEQISAKLNERYAAEVTALQSVQETGNLSGIFRYYSEQEGKDFSDLFSYRDGQVIAAKVDDLIDSELDSQQAWIDTLVSRGIREYLAEAMSAEYAKTNPRIAKLWNTTAAQEGIGQLLGQGTDENGNNVRITSSEDVIKQTNPTGLLTSKQAEFFYKQYEDELRDTYGSMKDFVEALQTMAKNAGKAWATIPENFDNTATSINDVETALKNAGDFDNINDFLDKVTGKDYTTRTIEDIIDAFGQLGYSASQTYEIMNNHFLQLKNETGEYQKALEQMFGENRVAQLLEDDGKNFETFLSSIGKDINSFTIEDWANFMNQQDAIRQAEYIANAIEEAIKNAFADLLSSIELELDGHVFSIKVKPELTDEPNPKDNSYNFDTSTHYAAERDSGSPEELESEEFNETTTNEDFVGLSHEWENSLEGDIESLENHSEAVNNNTDTTENNTKQLDGRVIDTGTNISPEGVTTTQAFVEVNEESLEGLEIGQEITIQMTPDVASITATISDIDYTQVTLDINGDPEEAKKAADSLNGRVVTITIKSNIPDIPESTGAMGINNSKLPQYAGGRHSNNDFQGIAETGELGQELWIHNGEPYLTGTHGRNKIFVSKGDQIFTAAQTREILRNNPELQEVPQFSVGYSNVSWGGSKSSDGVKNQKTKEFEPERYHVVTRQLKELERLYDLLSKAKDNAYGTNKLEAIQREIEMTDSLIEGQRVLIEEATKYYEQDLAHMKELGVNFELDEMGNIANWEELQDTIGRAANGGQDETATNQWKAIQQYEETIDKLNESKTELQNYIYQLSELALEKITTKVELLIDFDDKEINFIDYLIDRAENSSYRMAKILDLSLRKASIYTNQLKTSEKAIQDIFNEMRDEYGNLLSDNIDLETFLAMSPEERDSLHINGNWGEAIEDQADNLLEALEELNELKVQGVKEFDETVQKLNDDVEFQLDLFNHYNTVLSTLKDITELQGSTITKEIREMISDLNIKIFDNFNNNLEASLENYIRIQEQFKKIQQDYNEAIDEDIKAELEKQMKDAYTIMNEGFEEVLSLWENSLEVARTNFEETLDNIVTTYEESLSLMYSNFNNMQDAYERKKELDDFYVADYEKFYQLSKLQRNINKDLSTIMTSSFRNTKGLQMILSDIEKIRKTNQEVTKYDLEILEKRYEYEKALADLENAKSAKNQVRLQRDKNGNWGYVYTINEDNVAEAQQNVENALHEWQQTGINQINESAENLLNNIGSIMSTIADMRKNGTTEVEIADYLNDRVEFLRRQAAQFEKSLSDMNITEPLGQRLYDFFGFDIISKYGETNLKKLFGGDSLNIENIIDMIMKGSEQMNQTQNDYDSMIKGLNDLLKQFGLTIEGISKNISDNSNVNRDTSKQLINETREFFKEALNKAEQYYKSFINNEYLNEIKNIEKLLTKIYEVLGPLNKEVFEDEYDQPKYFKELASETLIEDLKILDTLNVQAKLAAQNPFMSYEIPTSSLDQNISNINNYFEVSFPNVTDHYEIEEAFNDLQNKATQFANNKINKIGIDI